MSQDEQNLNLLGIFHFVLGPLTILWSSVFLIHVGIGIATLHGGFFGGHSGRPPGTPPIPSPMPPPEVGWMFIIMGSVVVLLGWTLGILMIIAGAKLRRHAARTFCLVVAAIECAAMPFGTILGVFTIVVLMNESVSSLFVGNGSHYAHPDRC